MDMTDWMIGGLGLILGGLAGVLCVFFSWKGKSRKEKEELDQLKKEMSELQSLNMAAGERLKSCQQQAESEKQLLSQSFERERSLLDGAHRKDAEAIVAQWREKLDHQKALFENEKKVMTDAAETLKANHAADFEKMQKEHQAQLALLKEEFKNLSEKVLTDNTDKLHSANKEQMELLLNPLREKMGEFRTAVEESKNKSIEMNVSLKKELEKMMLETVRIGGEARDLAKALRGEQKTQGDWGELILEDILKRSGLQKGLHYECQETIRDADGRVVQSEEEKRMRPDVVIHYPDGRVVVVDSKVSLTAYSDYCNAEDENTRKTCLEKHLLSVKSHIKELVSVNYAANLRKNGHNAVDFTVMFIPNEGSFHLAMISDLTLWNDAFRQNILIVSPMNLMALLKIIHIAWTREEQNRNQQEILKTASMLLDRLYSFYKEFDDIGVAIGKVQQSYDNAVKRLKQGEHRQSVVGAGEKLKLLGIKPVKEKNLPARLMTPELELLSAAEPAAEKQIQTGDTSL